jgi:exosortase/archaeosortase family protein
MTLAKQMNLRFVVTLIIFAGAVFLTYREEVLGPLLGSLTTLTAKTTFVLLELLRINVTREVSVIYQPGGFAYEIDYRCTGVLPVACLAVAILAYPGYLRHKLAGLAVGIPLLIGLNLVRLVHLFLIGVTRPELFELAHPVLWNGAMILGVLGLWWAWRRWAHAQMNKSLRRDRPSHAERDPMTPVCDRLQCG